MSSLKKQLIRLGNREPELRKHLRPVLDDLTSRQKKATDGLNADEMVVYGEEAQSIAEDIIEDMWDFRKYNDASSAVEGMADEFEKKVLYGLLSDVTEDLMNKKESREVKKLLRESGLTDIEELGDTLNYQYALSYNGLLEYVQREYWDHSLDLEDKEPFLADEFHQAGRHADRLRKNPHDNHIF